MKKKFFLVPFLLFIPILSFAVQIKIMSFNVCSAVTWKNETFQEWLQVFSKIKMKSNADIILLQEVKGDVFLEQIKNKLGGNWRYFSTHSYSLKEKKIFGDENFSKCNENLNNAIFYNTEKLSGKDLAQRFNFTDFENSKYKHDKNNMQVVEFTVRNENNNTINKPKKLYVVNVHLPSDENGRMIPNSKHLKYLLTVKIVLTTISQLSRENAVIAGGDFNYGTLILQSDSLVRDLWLPEAKFLPNWTVDNGKIIGNSLDEKYIQEICTTVPRKITNISYPMDHFIYNDNIKNKIIEKMQLVTMRDNKKFIHIDSSTRIFCEEWHRTVSDHLPISISFEIN